MPETYTRKQSYVTAHQFEGWPDAIVIQQWIPGTVFVPRGYDHFLRSDREYDGSNGHILEDARSYLVFAIDGEHLRVDLCTWIVRDAGGELEFVIPADFAERFEPTQPNRTAREKILGEVAASASAARISGAATSHGLTVAAVGLIGEPPSERVRLVDAAALLVLAAERMDADR